MIVAVIVCYLPDINQLQLLCSSVSPQVSHIVLVDNSEPSQLVTSPLFDSANTSLLSMPKNVGLAKAQNEGIMKALSLGAEYVVVFDQDSEPGSDLIQKLHESFHCANQRSINLACVGARPYCVFEEQAVKPKLQKAYQCVGDLSFVRQIIASSMMISKRAVEEVGLMEAELFIDGVDHEWCWRAASKGFRVAIDERCVMPHRLGEARGSVLGLRYKVGSPVRLYYQFRNILLLSRRGYVPVYWKARNLIALPIRFFLMTCCEAPRVQRLSFMLKGLWHGVLGKSGPYS